MWKISQLGKAAAVIEEIEVIPLLQPVTSTAIFLSRLEENSSLRKEDCFLYSVTSNSLKLILVLGRFFSRYFWIFSLSDFFSWEVWIIQIWLGVMVRMERRAAEVELTKIVRIW